MLIINKNYITKKFIFETDKQFQKYANEKPIYLSYFQYNTIEKIIDKMETLGMSCY